MSREKVEFAALAYVVIYGVSGCVDQRGGMLTPRTFKIAFAYSIVFQLCVLIWGLSQ